MRGPMRARSLWRVVVLRGGDAAGLSGGSGRRHPFEAAQRAALKKAYADDMPRLSAGVEGLARPGEETGPDQAGTHPPVGQTQRGQAHDIEARHMA